MVFDLKVEITIDPVQGTTENRCFPATLAMDSGLTARKSLAREARKTRRRRRPEDDDADEPSYIWVTTQSGRERMA